MARSSLSVAPSLHGTVQPFLALSPEPDGPICSGWLMLEVGCQGLWPLWGSGECGQSKAPQVLAWWGHLSHIV